MNRSLQRHLSLMLGGATLFAGLIAAIVSFVLTYSEAKEFQDDMLRQIAVLDTGELVRSKFSEMQAQASKDIVISDQESRVMIFHLPTDSRPDWLSDNLPLGFNTLNMDSQRVRVFIRDRPAGRIVVAQLTDARDEIALNSALYALVPLLILPPLLTWLIIRIVRREFAPITRLTRGLDEQVIDRPSPLGDEGIPDEITPFVHAINRLLGRVSQLLGQQRRFIADAAHELRSPLAALSVQADNLMHARSLDAMRERVIPLQQGIDRAQQLTEQLLSLARIQAGTIQNSAIDVSAMARELIAEYLPLAEAMKIDLGLEEIAPLFLQGEPTTLRTMLRNALDNAMKYTQEGGEVTIRLLTTVIEIVDNGPGIPDSERKRVFAPFYRMQDSLDGGSGLGLTIAMEAATQLGGTLSLHERKASKGLVLRYQHKCQP